MKVLLINNCHYRRGGAETVYFETAEMLLKSGHEVCFFSIEDNRNSKTGQHEYFIPLGGATKRIVSYFNNVKAARMLEKVLMKEKPDIAHAHLLWGGITASIIEVLHKHGIPLVHTAHDYRMVCPAYTFRNGCGKVCEQCKGGKYWHCTINRCSKGSMVQSVLMTLEMFYRNRKWHPAKKLDGIIYVSSFAKLKHEEMDSSFKGTINTVLYNISTVGEKYSSVEKDGGYYLYFGRLSGEKGGITLVNAFANHPNLKLKVVGTGPIENEFKKKSYSNVEFLGFKTGEDLYDIVRNARFVCVPSEWYENNPMTIVEAYSMGVPVIGARIGGIPEIIEEGKTGFLFESGCSTSLEKVIEQSDKINTEEYLSLKRNALLFSENNFNSKTYPERLLVFYQKVINNKS